MYRAFFRLAKPPFSMTPDPEFLYSTDSHQEALAGLIYAIGHHKGYMVLSGDAGTGKTTVLTSIIASLSPKVHFSWILNPTLNSSEFIEAVMLDFGLSNIPESKALRITEFQKFLLEIAQRGETAVLVVDEAHKLQPEILEEIRLLGNFESATSKLLQIVLAGQSELVQLLDRYDLRQLKQRISIRAKIDPLNRLQVYEYIAHRWHKAGGGSPPPFTPEAVEIIAAESEGIPRVVNSICDNALLLAFALNSTTVTRDHVSEAVSDLHIKHIEPPQAVNGNGNGNGHSTKALVLTGSAPVTASPVTELHLAAPADELSGMPTLTRYLPPAVKLPISMRIANRMGIPIRTRPKG